MKGCFHAGCIISNKKVELEPHYSYIIFTVFLSLTFLLHCTTDNSKATLAGIESVIISGLVYLQTQLKSKECLTLSLQLCDHYFPFSSNSNCQQNEKQQQTSLALWMTGENESYSATW